MYKNDIKQTRRSANTFRHIDHLSTLNDGGEIEQNFKEIYPLGILLKKKNLSSNKGLFLDFFVVNNQFST